jgi:excisionase family DNA binding protein
MAITQSNFVAPSGSIASEAADAAKGLAPLVTKKRARPTVTIEARDDATRARVQVPMPALRLFLTILQELAKGHAVTLVPHGKEFTTQEAADFLNVSRPHVISLLEARKLPFRKVGTHRRIRVEDLLAFKERDDEERRRIADELTREGQEIGLDY